MADGILDRSRPRKLLVGALLEHGCQRVVVWPEKLRELVLMVFVHLRKQRLQGALADVPLQGAKADSLAVEVAGKPGEAIRGRVACFDGIGKSQTLMIERLRGHFRHWNVGPVETRLASIGPHSSIHGEVLGRLKSSDGRVCPAAEDSVDRPRVESWCPGGERLLNLTHFRSARSKEINRHISLLGNAFVFAVAVGLARSEDKAWSMSCQYGAPMLTRMPVSNEPKNS